MQSKHSEFHFSIQAHIADRKREKNMQTNGFSPMSIAQMKTTHTHITTNFGNWWPCEKPDSTLCYVRCTRTHTHTHTTSIADLCWLKIAKGGSPINWKLKSQNEGSLTYKIHDRMMTNSVESEWRLQNRDFSTPPTSSMILSTCAHYTLTEHTFNQHTKPYWKKNVNKD